MSTALYLPLAATLLYTSAGRPAPRPAQAARSAGAPHRASPPPAVTPRRAPGDTPPFVRVQGTRFWVGPRPFYFVGANVGVMHGPSQRRAYARVLGAVKRDGLTVVRVWAFGERPVNAPYWHRKWQAFRVGPRGWIPSAGRALDRVLAEARRLGLRVILVLGNNWGDYGGIPQYLRWARLGQGSTYGDLARFYSHHRTRRWYRMHVMRLLGRRNSVNGVRYAEDPVIMAWELLNESTVSPDGFAARRRFIRETAALIRRRAPRHLVASGVTGYATAARRAEWYRVCKLPQVSYCDAHLYPEESWRLQQPRDLGPIIDDRVQLAHYGAKKPILFGEYGFTGKAEHNASLHRPVSFWVNQFLGRVHFDGAAGALIWLYLPKCQEKRRYPIWIGQPDEPRSPLRRTLRRWARRFAAGPPARPNPRLGPRHGTRTMYPAPFTIARRQPPGLAWRPAPGGLRLALGVTHFVRARFFHMGFYAGGLVEHIYGDQSGYWSYPVPRTPFRLSSLTVKVRLSSEFPGDTAPPPPAGLSAVTVMLAGRPIAKIQAPPDDGMGKVFRIRVTDPKLLAALARRAQRLKLSVLPGPQARGLCVSGALGRRGRKAPSRVIGDTGPLELVGHRASP